MEQFPAGHSPISHSRSLRVLPSRLRTRLILGAALWLSLAAGVSSARVNLNNFGVNPNIGAVFEPGGDVTPPPGGGGGGPGSISDLEALGYICTPNPIACAHNSLASVETAPLPNLAPPGRGRSASALRVRGAAATLSPLQIQHRNGQSPPHPAAPPPTSPPRGEVLQ